MVVGAGGLDGRRGRRSLRSLDIGCLPAREQCCVRACRAATGRISLSAGVLRRGEPPIGPLRRRSQSTRSLPARGEPAHLPALRHRRRRSAPAPPARGAPVCLPACPPVYLPPALHRQRSLPMQWCFVVSPAVAAGGATGRGVRQ